MTANIDIVGEKRAKVLTVPVEAIFKKDETEVVYVKKPEAPKKAADKGGFLSSVFAAGKKDAPAAKLDPKDAWKEKFELRGDRDRPRRVDKVEIVKGLDRRHGDRGRGPDAPEGEEGQ